MKQPFIIITILFLGSVSFSQDEDSERVKNIRGQYKIINDYNNYSVLHLENEEFMSQMTDGGGELWAYFNKEQLSKIKTWIGLSNGTIMTEYYFWKEDLFFIYEEQSQWYYDVENDAFDYDFIQEKVERRYYLHADTVFLVKLYDQDPWVTDDNSHGNKLAQLGKGYVEILKAKRK